MRYIINAGNLELVVGRYDGVTGCVLVGFSTEACHGGGGSSNYNQLFCFGEVLL